MIKKSIIFIATCAGALLLLTVSTETVSAQPQMPFVIRSVTIRNEAGQPITSATRGQFIFVDIVIENTEAYAYAARPFLLVARLTYGFPPSLMGLSGYKGSLAGGEQANPTPGLQIPLDGPTGTYSITVLVFSDWPAAGGIVVAVPYTMNLPVVG